MLFGHYSPPFYLRALPEKVTRGHPLKALLTWPFARRSSGWYARRACPAEACRHRSSRRETREYRTSGPTPFRRVRAARGILAGPACSSGLAPATRCNDRFRIESAARPLRPALGEERRRAWGGN